MKNVIACVLLTFFYSAVFSQDLKRIINEKVLKDEVDKILLAPNYSKDVKTGDGVMIHLPDMDGNISEYRFFKNDFMSQEMQKNYPDITTYTGYSVSNRSEFINIVKHGDKVSGILMGHSSHRLFEIDNGQYSVKEDQNDQLHQNVTGGCGTDHSNFRPFLPNGKRSNTLNVQLRKFRLAIVITDEFEFATNGGNNAIASAILIVSNLNAFYKKELAIEFIPIVKPEIPSMPINPSYSAVRGGQVISQYYTLLEYDLGHVFHKITNNLFSSRGQVASIESVCNNTGNPPFKASAWTEGNVPLSSSFLEVLIHEIAHMFGATHTFNGTAPNPMDLSTGCLNNQRSPLTSFEPGAGTTLMSYSGSCGSHNIELPDNSDAPRSSYFHAGSINQILAFLENNPNVCGIPEPLSNSSPVITPITTGLTLPIKLPKSTPFELKGQALDPDGDILTYCWEQMDSGPPHGAINVACNSSTGPIFRSYDPKPDPSRFFPDLQFIINNGNIVPNFKIGECLPSGSRDLNFQLTVRDNHPQGGGIAFDNIIIKIDGDKGPLTVTAPNTPSWAGGAKQIVTWQVNKTNEICDRVNILLSFDDGYTFPYILAKNIQNDGSFEITMPESIPSSKTARIKVESNCSEFIKFFDISNVNFNLNTSCPILFKFGICNDKPLAAIEGSESLSLNLPKEVNRINSNLLLTTASPRGSFPINLEPNSGNQNFCTIVEALWYSQKIEFIVNKSGNYVFEVTGERIISVFNNSYNPNAPCDNYIGSNGSTNNPNLGFSYFPSLTLNLNAECRKYTVVLFTQSITNNTKIKVSGPTGSFFLVPELIAPDFDITYLAVDSFSHIIKAIHPSADFKGLIPGTYKIYGLYYYAGSASLPQKLNLTALLNTKLTDVLSYNSCFAISQNFKPLKILPKCTTVLDPPALTGNTSLCLGQPTTITATGGSSYRWSTQDNTASITVSPTTTTTYTVTVTDSEGCSGTKSIFVTVHPNPMPNISGKENICHNSILELDAGQGFTAYLWSDGGGTAQKATYPNLTSNKTFTVTVTDTNGCQGTDNFEIMVRPQPNPVITGHQNLCNGNEVTLSTTTSYTSYSWSGGGGSQAQAVYRNVTPGSQYSVTVTDIAGCTGINAVTIGNFTGLSVVLTAVNTSCGLNNGSLTATVGTQGNYTYQWNIPQSGSQITGLASGTYTVTVSDERGCTGSSSVSILSSSSLTLSKNVTHATCGLNNGSATIIATGGAGYQYLWNDKNTSAARQNMAPGTYTVIVTATGDCSATAEVIIENSLGLTLSAVTQNTTCGLANGSITIMASGGTEYSYLWSNDKTESSISGLQSSSYIVTVTDQRNCSAVLQKTILSSSPLTVVISGPDEICDGGVANIFIPEGLSYKWSTGATTASIQVPSGQYTITVTDQQNCTAVATKNIQQKVLPTPVIQGPDGACGIKSVTLTIQNGNIFKWSLGQTTNSIEVTAGTYVVTVTDLNGCTSSSSKTVALLPVPQVAISGPDGLCAGGTGTISVPEGFTYRWSNSSTVASITIPPGAYNVTVTNQQGCSSVVSKSIQTLSTPAQVILGPQGVCRNQSATLSVADGNTFKWSTGQTTKSITVFSGTYAVTVTEAGGCSSVATKTLSDFSDPLVGISGPEGVCDGSLLPITASGGVSYRWNNGASAAQIQVAAGSYTVTATDVNGCTASAIKNVKIFILPVAGIAGNIQTCPGKMTTLTAHFGPSYKWNTQQTSQVIQAGPGTYTVTVTDVNGCSEVASRSVTLYDLTPVAVDGNEGVCTGSQTRLTATGGVKYLWSNNNTGQSVDIQAGNYTVTITDKYNCTSIVSKNVISNPQPSVQSHTITFNAVSQNQMTLRWKPGNGAKRLVVAKAGSPVNGLPVNGTQYFAGSAFGQGSTIAPGEFVVYYGEQSEVTLTQLTANVTYYFRVYEAGCQNNFLSSVTTGNPASQQALCAPAIPSQTISFNGVSTEQFAISWTNGNGSHRVVKLNTTNQFTTPAAGSNPTAQSTYNGSGEQVVFNGTGNSVVVKGLVPGTTYWVRIYEANCDGNKTVYNPSASTGNPASQKTITALPYFQSLVVSELNDFGVNKVWVPVYTNNNVYGSNPPIILNATGNKSTRFSIQSSNASKISIYLTNKAGRIVTGKNISYNPDRYGTFDPFSYPSHDRFDVEFTNPSILEEQPYTSLRLHILYDDGLTGLTIPVQIYKTEAIPLPVVYQDISAKWQKADKRIMLDWSIASESNNDFFEVERSFENQDFRKIAKLPGAMHSTNQNNYLYYDYDIDRTGHYTYRILQTDLDGNSVYSWPVSASVSGDRIIKTSLYPNPASGLINLYIEAYEGADLKVEIFNGLGQMIRTDLAHSIMTESSWTYPIEGNKLMEGLYSVIISIDGVRYTHKLIVLR